jgi:protein SCO1/2
MQKVIKWLFLFLLIALPVSVYVFLQAFGDNKFTIPIYYEKGITDIVTGCDQTLGQHIVPAFVENDSISTQYLNGIVIYNIGDVDKAQELEKSNNLLMLNEKLDVWKHVVYEDLTNNKDELVKFANCGLILRHIEVVHDYIKNDTLVLVDNQGRIRGYYGVLDRVEVDRLITEVNVLLTE